MKNFFLPIAFVLSSSAFAQAADWEAQAREDARQDRVVLAYDGVRPDSMVCDTTIRELADGSWMLLILAGDSREPSPKNYVGVARSNDQGRTWSKLEPFDTGLPRAGDTIGSFSPPTATPIPGGSSGNRGSCEAHPTARPGAGPSSCPAGWATIASSAATSSHTMGA